MKNEQLTERAAELKKAVKIIVLKECIHQNINDLMSYWWERRRDKIDAALGKLEEER